MPLAVTKVITQRPRAGFMAHSLAALAVSGTYTSATALDLTGLQLNVPLEELISVGGVVFTAAGVPYFLIYTKGTNLTNGTLKLFTGAGVEATGTIVASGNINIYTGLRRI